MPLKVLFYLTSQDTCIESHAELRGSFRSNARTYRCAVYLPLNPSGYTDVLAVVRGKSCCIDVVLIYGCQVLQHLTTIGVTILFGRAPARCRQRVETSKNQRTIRMRIVLFLFEQRSAKRDYCENIQALSIFRPPREK